MANPKYADLPGIAHDQPDVYETSDLPESDQLSSDIIVDQSESVEQVALSPSEAFGKFKGKTLNASGVDFTDRIDRSRRSGYEVRAGNWEMLGEGAEEEEAPHQRYQRLKHEIRELLEQVNQMKEMAQNETNSQQMSPVALSQNIEELQKQLVELNMEQVLGSEAIADLTDLQGTLQKKLIAQLEAFKELGVTSTPKAQTKATDPGINDAVTYELYIKPEHAKMKEIAKIADLDQRIKQLEFVIGQDKAKLSPLTTHTNEKSIAAAINILSAKISLLDPSHLEQIEGRLVVLHQQLQKVSEKKTQIEDADKQVKISELYTLMKKAEVMSTSLPNVVDRLAALRELHEQALQFSKALTQLDTTQQQISSSLKNNEKLLQDLQETFGKNMEIIKNNMASLNDRIAALKK